MCMCALYFVYVIFMILCISFSTIAICPFFMLVMYFMSCFPRAHVITQFPFVLYAVGWINYLSLYSFLNMIEKFNFCLYFVILKRLGLPALNVAEKYTTILQRFGREIENTAKNYQRNKNDPPIARDLPPISGKITWARQMFRRISEPMEEFQQRPKLLQSNEGKKIIRNYNKLAKVLMEFEVLYHRAWLRQVRTFSGDRTFFQKISVA